MRQWPPTDFLEPLEQKLGLTFTDVSRIMKGPDRSEECGKNTFKLI